MVQGERPEHRALRGADGDRPAGSQSVPERQLAEILPKEIGRDVGDEHRLVPERGRTA